MEIALRVSHFLNPATFELERDRVLLLDGGRVAEVVPDTGQTLSGLADKSYDFEGALAMPGFVNGHAHLDLSHLHGQVPSGLKFHEWAPAVIAGRQMPQKMIAAGINDACRMMAASGTTAVLDISVNGDSAAPLAKHGLRGTVALEVLGDPDAAMQHADKIVRTKFELDRDRLGNDAGESSAPVKPEGVDYGFSPHAPFSTGIELYQHAFGRAFGEGRVCTTHVAETLEEEAFVREGTGPLKELLDKLGAGASSFEGYGRTPLSLLLDDWLAPWLGEDNPHVVLVHCNYARDEDFQHLAATRPTVCWCPRSHRWFDHAPWPLAKMCEAGVNLTLGTDSLASNVGLDMLGEIRLAAEHPDADTAELFQAATVNGRKAMGIPNDAADLAIWGIPAGHERADRDTLLTALLTHEAPLYAAISQGNLIARAI